MPFFRNSNLFKKKSAFIYICLIHKIQSIERIVKNCVSFLVKIFITERKLTRNIPVYVYNICLKQDVQSASIFFINLTDKVRVRLHQMFQPREIHVIHV